MPVDWSRYPENWTEIALAVKEAADWRCQRCGLQCRRPGEPFDTQRHTLTVAHWPDSDTMNCAPENLLALCSACHLRADAPMHARHARQTRERRQRDGGQATFAAMDGWKSGLD